MTPTRRRIHYAAKTLLWWGAMAAVLSALVIADRQRFFGRGPSIPPPGEPP